MQPRPPIRKYSCLSHAVCPEAWLLLLSSSLVDVGYLEPVHEMLYSEIRRHRTAHSFLPGPRTHRRDIRDTRTVASKGRRFSRHLTELKIGNFSHI